MDIARPSRARQRRIRQVVYVVGAVLILAGTTAGLSQLRPAAPTVDRDTVWLGTVVRGEMLREVRGPGSLVPERIWWIPAASEGRVVRADVLPGTPVTADSVLIELSNPELELTALTAEYDLRGEIAESAALEKRLQTQELDQEAKILGIAADHHEAGLQAEVDRMLHESGDRSELQRKLSEARYAELENRLVLERRRLGLQKESSVTELARQDARVERARAMLERRRGEVEALKIRAGLDGVLDQLAVQVGQQVTPGMTLARVIDVQRLKAVLRIPETQTRDVVLGQRARVDTRNAVIEGRVARIDPAVQNGTVTVDITLVSPLPRGARPDLTVDGTIELERLDDVLSVGRPVYGQADSTISLFKFDPLTEEAVRVPVRLGSSSVNSIQVVEGLLEGDTVILSDMSTWDDENRIRLR